MNIEAEYTHQGGTGETVDDPTVTEYPINSYVLFTPQVGRSDKLLPSAGEEPLDLCH